MAELIKPCPFCGGEAVQTFNTRFGYQIFCENTHCFMNEITTQNIGKSEETVIEQWNNRVTEAEIRAKAIDEFLEKIKPLIYGMQVKYIDEIAEQLKEE